MPLHVIDCGISIHPLINSGGLDESECVDK